jgi:hypothetical protein
MATINHTNLSTYNVPALTEFFRSVFGFWLVEKRADKLSVLRNAEGFVLILMYDKRMTPEQGYPGMFHVGFLQPTQHAVDLVHDDLSIRNYMSPKPAKLQRGGPPTYGFSMTPRWRNGGSQHDEHCRTRLTASPSGESPRVSLLAQFRRLTGAYTRT